MSHIPSKLLSFSEASTAIRKNLVAQKLPVFREQWVEKLRGRFVVVVDERI
jgi:hypothetical protein